VVGGVAKGDLWIIGARPSMGKTALMCNSALQTARKGTKVLLLSLEMSRQAIIERMLAIETGIPVFNLRLGILDQKDVDKITATVNEIKNLPIFINTKFVPDLSYVESIIRNKKSSENIDIVYLDYIQLLTARDEDSTQELGRISQKLKMLARDLDIGVCILSQLSRDLEKRPSKRPVMSDLRQSGYLEEDADLVAFLYRDEVYNPNTEFKNVMEFIIRKQRNGSIGTIPLTFESETNKIY
jgi:Replicative DNA helicase